MLEVAATPWPALYRIPGKFMHLSRAVPAALAGALVVVIAGCSTGAADTSDALRTATTTAPAAAAASEPPAPAPGAAKEPVKAPATSSASAEPADRTTPRTETALLSIPAIGLEDLRVVPYEGTTDDWPGTRIQNRGVGASPYGENGGVGPGDIGNYLVTAHRLSSGGPLRDLPSLKNGDSVIVEEDGLVYEYEITGTRQTSFRSDSSLAAQRAPVPGKPGVKPTQAMITVSTCATPEDDAAGNFWRDDRHNPEHRIDKIGVLKKAPSPAAGN